MKRMVIPVGSGALVAPLNVLEIKNFCKRKFKFRFIKFCSVEEYRRSDEGAAPYGFSRHDRNTIELTL